jgi:hypothetical protein
MVWCEEVDGCRNMSGFLVTRRNPALSKKGWKRKSFSCVGGDVMNIRFSHYFAATWKVRGNGRLSTISAPRSVLSVLLEPVVEKCKLAGT